MEDVNDIRWFQKLYQKSVTNDKLYIIRPPQNFVPSRIQHWSEKLNCESSEKIF